MNKSEMLLALQNGASRRDIAQHYFPSTTAVLSVAKMHRWILADNSLYNALLRAGYRNGMHHFTPKIIKTFVRFFG